MFTYLKNAQIFSKFDLKSEFWQVGIKPSERYKTAFCIPNAHYQWTVLPFGLNTTPSISKKLWSKSSNPFCIVHWFTFQKTNPAVPWYFINYIRDFIPHVDHHTRQLSTLLKKNPPSWNNNHTLAVTMLKQIAQNPPPLKLITYGRRILQTDASDESWGAILLKETHGKEHFIAHASGHFWCESHNETFNPTLDL